jgi:hypothetical protein
MCIDATCCRCCGDRSCATCGSPCDARCLRHSLAMDFARSQDHHAWRRCAIALARPYRWQAKAITARRKVWTRPCGAHAEYMGMPDGSHRGRGRPGDSTENRDQHYLRFRKPLVDPTECLLEPDAVDYAGLCRMSALQLQLSLEFVQLRVRRSPVSSHEAAIERSADLPQRRVKCLLHVRRLRQIPVLQHYSRNVCVSK